MENLRKNTKYHQTALPAIDQANLNHSKATVPPPKPAERLNKQSKIGGGLRQLNKFDDEKFK